jgi:hypothetical protein
MDGRLTRASLLRAAGAAAAALGLGRLAGRSDDAFAGDSVSCVLTPEQTEGPYYIADEKLRRNITDDGIFRSGGKRSLLSLRRNSPGYVGSIRMGVRR